MIDFNSASKCVGSVEGKIVLILAEWRLIGLALMPAVQTLIRTIELCRDLYWLSAVVQKLNKIM